MFEVIDRRHFLGAAAATIAASKLGLVGSLGALSDETKPASMPAMNPAKHTDFGPLKQIEAGRAFAEQFDVRRIDGDAAIDADSLGVYLFRAAGIHVGLRDHAPTSDTELITVFDAKTST